jgi:bacillithiol system protein YtxJ
MTAVSAVCGMIDEKFMNWIELKSLGQVDELKNESKEHPVLIFKHSFRCNISRAALDRLERNWKNEEMKMVKPYFLDLITFREISNAIADSFKIDHESPQILLIEQGQAVLNLSHFEIDYNAIKEAIEN